MGSRIIKHEDFEFLCTADPADRGQFVPGLVVTRRVWPTRPRVIAVQRGHHLTEEAAIAAAIDQGVEWVRNYG
ncbi:MAG: hypothetical protein KGN16_19160 [Burkholderiales bacterium]|nr:hypothetical protein [Burkholderiales bacterium]